jgi:tetratricopeptide (TPR) repeat protein
VRVSLAVIATRAGHFEDAQNLLNSVDLLSKKKAFSGRALEALACAKMELALTQKNYSEALTVWQNSSGLPQEKSADLLGLAAVANAGNSNASTAVALLAKIDEDDNPGQLDFYTAWVADLAQTLPAQDIIKLYQKALDRAISAKQYYTVAQILKRLGETERANTIFSSLGL